MDDFIYKELSYKIMEAVFEARVYSYLKATGLKLGILINFGKKKVEYKRIAN